MARFIRISTSKQLYLLGILLFILTSGMLGIFRHYLPQYAKYVKVLAGLVFVIFARHIYQRSNHGC